MQTRPIILVGILHGALASAGWAGLVAADNLHGTIFYSGFFIGVGYTNNSDWINQAAGQEFVAQVGGRITTLIATVDRFDGVGVPLMVGVYGKSGGTVGSLLGQVSFPPSALPVVNGFNSFDLSSAAINLTAGQSYYAIFTTTSPLLFDVRYRALLWANPAFAFGIQPIDSRNGGATWVPEGISPEIGLTVNVVPLPSSGILACLLTACVITRPRRIPS